MVFRFFASLAISLVLGGTTSVDGFTATTLCGRRFVTSSSQFLSSEVAQVAAQVQEANAQQPQPHTPSWTDDGFVYGLPGSGLDRQKSNRTTAAVTTVVKGDSLETTTTQVAIVATTLAMHAAFLVSCVIRIVASTNGSSSSSVLSLVSTTAATILALTVSSWIAADFGSGVLHWAVDNYGNGRTPVMGSIIAAFQGHHCTPWTITHRGFCNNVHKLCTPFGALGLPLSMALMTIRSSAAAGPKLAFFASSFCVWEILSQEFHKWSHSRPSQVPRYVHPFMAMRLVISRAAHAQHHVAPYMGNYAIISGVTNGVLDRVGFYRRLEHVIYKWNGVEANAWKLDPVLKKRTLAGDYGIPDEAKASLQVS
jgi:palmitoyl-[glycerolipid] 3-(E)-desaturase